MLFCSLNALQQVTCFSQQKICVRAPDRLNIVCLDCDGCLPLGSAGCSISYHILHSIPESIRSVTHIDLYVNLYLLFRQLVSKGLSNPSFGLHRAPIVHSGHSLLLHFTWGTYHGALSRSVYKHQRLLHSPVRSLSETNNRHLAMVNRQCSKRKFMPCDNKWQFS